MQSSSSEKAGGKRPARTKSLRWIYAGAALLLLILAYLGFQSFYLHGQKVGNRPLSPETKILTIVHGLSMSLWMLLLLVQSLLVATGRIKIHRAIGVVGTVLAALIVVPGFYLGIASTRLAPEAVHPWGITMKQFMVIPLFSVLLFAVFVALGVIYRKRAAIHRPMMLLATLSAIPAATDRYMPLASLYRPSAIGSIFGPYCSMLGFGVIFLVVILLVSRTFDRWFAIGWAALMLASAGMMKLATTDAWDGIAGFLLGG